MHEKLKCENRNERHDERVAINRTYKHYVNDVNDWRKSTQTSNM
jgi:hypothetical protein